MKTLNHESVLSFDIIVCACSYVGIEINTAKSRLIVNKSL